MAKNKIDETVLFTVWKRDSGKCQNCGKFHNFKEPSGDKTWGAHHCYFKSQYKGTDRNEEWNLTVLCNHHPKNYQDCHKGMKGVHGVNDQLNRKLKLMADKRKPKDFREYGMDLSLKEKRKARKAEYRRKVEKFKKEHDGLTPFQHKYRQYKETKLRHNSKNT